MSGSIVTAHCISYAMHNLTYYLVQRSSNQSMYEGKSSSLPQAPQYRALPLGHPGKISYDSLNSARRSPVIS